MMNANVENLIRMQNCANQPVMPIMPSYVSFYDCMNNKEAQYYSLMQQPNIAQQEIKESKENKSNMTCFDISNFGACDGSIRMSAYGMAVQNADGNWVSYDKENKCIMNVDVFNFEADNMFFKIPIGLPQVKSGDVLIHTLGKPVFVIENNSEQGTLTVVDPVDESIKDILPAKSPFGFNFVIKIISLFDTMNIGQAAPTAENPFGGMGMYMLISTILGKDTNKDATKATYKGTGGIKSILPLLLMNFIHPDAVKNGDFMNSPLMWALMLK